MPNEEVDAREEALQYAARLQGLTLVRTGDRFDLVDFKLRGASLDQVASYLGADGDDDDRRQDDNRRTDLRALLKAERAMLNELESEKRQASEQRTERTSTADALAEIRRRIAEISQERGMKTPGGRTRYP
jgi:hypothetical protein